MLLLVFVCILRALATIVTATLLAADTVLVFVRVCTVAPAAAPMNIGRYRAEFVVNSVPCEP